MSVRLIVSPQMLAYLEHVQAECIGGSKPIYVVADRNKPKGVRLPLDEDNVTGWSGIQLNPKHRRDRLIQADSTPYWRNPPEEWHRPVLPDTTFTMDFDFYDKSGNPKPGLEPRTFDEMIARFRAEGVPLPVWAVPTSTPGNFQLTWLLEHPQERMSPKKQAAMVAYWGADPNYTNSVSWNPEYRHHHPNKVDETTRWWDDWADEMPLLATLDDLKGAGFHRAMAEAQMGAATTEAALRVKDPLNQQKVRRRGHQRCRTMPLEQMHDGHGRKRRITAEIRRLVCDHLTQAAADSTDTPRAVSVERLLEFASGLSLRMAEPLTPDELEMVVKPWTSMVQVCFWSHQRAASRSRMQPKEDRLQAEQKWIRVSYVAWRLALRHGDRLTGEPYANPFHGEYDVEALGPEFVGYYDHWYDQDRVEAFTGRRVHKGRLTWAYIAHVAGYWTDEVIDETTGEVTRPAQPDAKGVQNLMYRATERRYSLKDYIRRSQTLDQEQAAREAERQRMCDLDLPSLLTAGQRQQFLGTTVGEVQQEAVDPVPPKEWFEQEGYYDEKDDQLPSLDDDPRPAVGGDLPDLWPAGAGEGPALWSSAGSTDHETFRRTYPRPTSHPPLHEEMSFEDELARLQHMWDELEVEVA